MCGRGGGVPWDELSEWASKKKSNTRHQQGVSVNHDRKAQTVERTVFIKMILFVRMRTKSKNVSSETCPLHFTLSPTPQAAAAPLSYGPFQRQSAFANTYTGKTLLFSPKDNILDTLFGPWIFPLYLP